MNSNGIYAVGKMGSTILALAETIGFIIFHGFVPITKYYFFRLHRNLFRTWYYTGWVMPNSGSDL